MKDKRRGHRTRRSEDSILNPPFNDRTPSGADDSEFEDEIDQDSEDGTKSRTNDEERNNRDSVDEEYPDDDESRSTNGRTQEEQAEWQKLQNDLAASRKRKADADRKITEQGQTNSTLEQQLEESKSEIALLKSRQSKLLAGGNGSESSDAFGRNYSDEEQGNEMSAEELREEVSMLRGIVSKHIGRTKNVEARFDNLENEQEYEADLNQLESKFGVDREAAETLIDAFDQGNVVAFAQALEMSSLPRETRKSLQQHRAKRRTAAAVGQPGVPNPHYTPDDTGNDAARMKKAEQIDRIRGVRARTKAIDEAIENDPGMYKFIANQTGFNV